MEGIIYAELPSHEDLSRNSLIKLSHDVTDVKCNIEKKKAKITLAQINDKIDVIINLLQTPHGETGQPNL